MSEQNVRARGGRFTLARSRSRREFKRPHPGQADTDLGPRRGHRYVTLSGRCRPLLTAGDRHVLCLFVSYACPGATRALTKRALTSTYVKKIGWDDHETRSPARTYV